MSLSFDELEIVYEALAKAIDEAGEKDAQVFLAKLCLWLANDLGDGGRALEGIRACLADLPSATKADR